MPISQRAWQHDAVLKAACQTNTGEWIQIADLAEISDLTGVAGNVVWAVADVATLSGEDIARIAEEFGLHQLAVDDSIALRQRPKLEAYENHMFAVVHQLDERDGDLTARQIANFIGPRWVITIHEGADGTITETERRFRLSPSAQRGAEMLMHTLLDTLVDSYQALADRLEQEIEDLEETVLAAPDAPVERRLYSLKQHLSRFRRYVLPVARILDRVVEPSGSSTSMITAETSAHFRDVDDHLQRIADQVKNVDDLSNAVVDLNRSAQTQALNEATKRLSAWAAIIAVPTFIASVYGMNFRLFPPDGEPFGFWFALTLMAATGSGLYVYFRRRRWL